MIRRFSFLLMRTLATEIAYPVARRHFRYGGFWTWIYIPYHRATVIFVRFLGYAMFIAGLLEWPVV
jgi:hypothetical protein